MTQETSEQRHERWRREQEADEVAVTLGLAFQSEKQGICYWNGNGDAFRAGYEAGKTKLRSSHEQIATQSAPWDGVINPADFTVSTFTHGVNSSWLPKPQNGVCITHKPTGCFESETSLKSSHANKAMAWDRLIKRLEALAITAAQQGDAS